MIRFLICVFFCFCSPTISVFAQISNLKQNFEADFKLVNSPEEFLPGWKGNELRASSSRIFQSNLGRNNSKALAVQPIATFNGELMVTLFNEDFQGAKVQFWARSLQNGTGSRAAEVFISWKGSKDSSFSPAVLLGGPQEFANQNQEFRKFELEIPPTLKDQPELVLKIEIRYGSGTGSAARWMMDDFEFGDFSVDLTSPVLLQVRGYDSDQLELQFSEALDPVFPLFQLNYSLDGLQPGNAQLKNDSLVYLTFEKKLTQGEKYALSVKQLADLSGNFLNDTLVQFIFHDPTHIPWKGLVINEIMPAPKADQDLPNVEYVELFHAGEYPYRMQNISFSNSRVQVKLSEYWLLPGKYLLLVPQNQGSVFKDSGLVLEVASWPTLLNSGDRIQIATDRGEAIDGLSYLTSSWGGSQFAGGGYSLEVVNPFYACEQSELLRASEDPLRGTPGRVNSVFDSSPDREAPNLEELYFINSRQVLIGFSEPIFPDFTSSNLFFNPLLEVENLEFIAPKSIRVNLKTEAQLNLIYQLTINGIKDCSGNEFVQKNPIGIVLPKPAQKGDLIINELLFNPKTGSPKFVELYNRTDSYLEIGNWKIGNLNELGEPAQLRLLSSNRLQIPPGGFLAVTTSVERLKLDYPLSASGGFHLLASLPSYPITAGNVVLVDAVGSVAEILSYTKEMHHPLLRDPKGVSLERISSENPATNSSNWQSAGATVGYATPGMKNSQAISGEFLAQVIQIEPKVFDPQGSQGNTFTSIRYELDQSGWLGNFRIYSLSGQLIQVLAQNQILGTSGLLTWTGTDAQGQIVRPGYYILLVELYDLNGQTQSIKETIIVATGF